MFGNGAIAVTDWVQAGRYAAGLDPVTPAGGPTAVLTHTPRATIQTTARDGASRRVVVEASMIEPGRRVSARVRVEGAGDENAFAFSLGFDARALRFLEARATGQTGTFLVNDIESGLGRVGLAFAGVPSVPLGSGAAVELLFERIGLEQGPVLEFGDAPTRREMATLSAEEVPAVFEVNWDGATSPVPGLTIVQSAAGSLRLSWPGSVGKLVLESTDDLSRGAWLPVPVPMRTVGPEVQVEIQPLRGRMQFFRLRVGEGAE